jgi:hypothetical protein
MLVVWLGLALGLPLAAGRLLVAWLAVARLPGGWRDA